MLEERGFTMAISEKQVKHVANLAKLEFPEAELHGFTETLGKIINMVEQLEEVDTTGVPFTSNVVETINVMREDVAKKGMDRDELLKNVPESEAGFIKVPAILDDGEAGA
jgi:aspartyl-tRNA(Asn)/glutamyl-tRNA(Gln) amidotransferase subunit C